MVIIDHSTFPHIIESIWSYVAEDDYAAKAVMAKTCREWRQWALHAFHHIVNLRVKSTWTLSFEWSRYNLQTITLRYAERGLLAGCRFLDIYYDREEDAWGDTGLADLCRFLPSLDTVRFALSEDQCQGQPVIPARQLVFSGVLPTLLNGCPEIKRIVIHMNYQERYQVLDWPDLSELTGLEELIFIFEEPPWDLEVYEYAESDSDSDSGTDGDINTPYQSRNRLCPKLQLRTIRYTAQAALRQGANVIITGMEEWGQRLIDGLKLGIQWQIVPAEKAFASQNTLSLVNLCDYESFVGEREWEVQTIWDFRLWP